MMFLILLYILGPLVLCSIFWSHHKRTNVFQKYGVTHKKPLPFFGNLFPAILRADRFIDFIQEIYNLDKDAKYVGFYHFNTPVFMIRDEELVKSISIKNFGTFVDRQGLQLVNEPIFEANLFSLRGEKWRQTRNIVLSAFTPNKIRLMFQSVSQRAESYAEHIQKTLSLQDMVDTKDTFTRFTVDVIALYAFGFEIDSVKEPNNAFYRFGRELMDFGTPRFFMHFFFQRLFPSVFKIFGLQLFPEKKLRFFQNVIENSIKERQEKKIQRPDLIQLLLESRNCNDGRGLTPAEMNAQAFAFFIGGFHTTSSLMCMVAHFLSVYPEVQDKLCKEIDQILEKHEGALEYEHLSEFAYLEAVIQEVHRMQPTGPFSDRVCIEDFKLPPAVSGADPIPLKKGSVVWFPTHAFHHDPRFFENPEKFDPERFVTMNKNKTVPSVYMPFGKGPRICIGSRFALMEIKLLLIHILSRCELIPCAKTQYPFKIATRGFSMTPKEGFWLSVRSRREKITTS